MRFDLGAEVAKLALAVTMLLGCSALAQAQFTDLYVFGDSLSDIGNLSTVTLGIQPGDEYYEGRFSNGPVYSELLANKLGIDDFERSIRGGNNYAYAGGRTSGTSFFEGGLFIRDLDDQVDDYLDDRTVDPDALYVVLAGGNDFVLGNQTDAAIPAIRVGAEINRLIEAGVQHLLSINLPLLGFTPRFASATEDFNNRSRSFNEVLSGELDALASSSDANVYRTDLASTLEMVTFVPSAFGFTNTTDPGIEQETAAGHLYWDEVHPTTQAHELLASAAFSLFDVEHLTGDLNFNATLDPDDVDVLSYGIANDWEMPLLDLNQDSTIDSNDVSLLLKQADKLNGDLDFDGEVGFQDFLKLARNFDKTEPVLWSSGDIDSDGIVQFSDFLILARNFGKTSVAAAPEPHSSLLLTLGSVVLLGFRQRSRLAMRVCTPAGHRDQY